MIVPAHRDHRRYAEVVNRYPKNNRPPSENVLRSENKRPKIKLIENDMVKERLKVAAVIEVEKEVDMEPAVESLKGMNISTIDFSHLSPFKFAVFFEDKLKLVEALKRKII